MEGPRELSPARPTPLRSTGSPTPRIQGHLSRARARAPTSTRSLSPRDGEVRERFQPDARRVDMLRQLRSGASRPRCREARCMGEFGSSKALASASNSRNDIPSFSSSLSSSPSLADTNIVVVVVGCSFSCEVEHRAVRNTNTKYTYVTKVPTPPSPCYSIISSRPPIGSNGED